MNKVKVLHFSTHNEECGIAKYNEQLIEAMDVSDVGVTNEIFSISPNVSKNMSSQEFHGVLKQLVKQSRNFDVVHVQHELSFFKHNELDDILSALRSIDKKTVVTVHTAPSVQIQSERLGGVGPRSFLQFFKAKRFNAQFINRYFTPLQKASLILVPNNITQESIQKFQSAATDFKIFTHHIPDVRFTLSSNEIKDNLTWRQGDIIFATVGFLSHAKGISQAVKALNFLPKTYKLAIIGGSHPLAQTHSYYDEITDLVAHYGLQDRVYITGYVKDDDTMDALIRECDICVYPYNTDYYGYVSSAALNNGIGNHKAVIAYPTKAFIEIDNEAKGVLTLPSSPNYYELARAIRTVDISQASEASKEFAKENSASKKARELAKIYTELVS